VRYYGEQRSERDQKCALCGCWISEERVYVVKGCMLVCEKCHKQISGCGPSVIAHQFADWLVEKRGKSHDEADAFAHRIHRMLRSDGITADGLRRVAAQSFLASLRSRAGLGDQIPLVYFEEYLGENASGEGEE
jgi:hypothetical protein